MARHDPRLKYTEILLPADTWTSLLHGDALPSVS